MTFNNKFAVSLKYPEGVRAPIITAKASGPLAKRMLELAEENDVPVVEDDILAAVLSMRQIGECIPESTWEAVAGIFALIEDIEDRL